MGVRSLLVASLVAVVAAVGCTGDRETALPDPCALLTEADAEQLVGPTLALRGPDGVLDGHPEASCRWIGTVDEVGARVHRELVVSVARPGEPCDRVTGRIAGGAQSVAAGAGEGYLVPDIPDHFAELGACPAGYAVTLRYTDPNAPTPVLELSRLLQDAAAAVPDAPITTGIPDPPPDRFAAPPESVCAAVDPSVVATATGITGDRVEQPRSPRRAGGSCEIGVDPTFPISDLVVNVDWFGPRAHRSGTDVAAAELRAQQARYGATADPPGSASTYLPVLERRGNLVVTVFATGASSDPAAALSPPSEAGLRTVARSVAERLVAPR